MPPRLPPALPRSWRSSVSTSNQASSALLVPLPKPSTVASSSPTTPRKYATASAAIAGVSALRVPDDYVPPTQPPSARPPNARKSQLLRMYTSLLRSCPLILMFQHNNITGPEWQAIRRELKFAFEAVPASKTLDGTSYDVASRIKLQVIRTQIFNVALKVVEFFDPAAVKGPTTTRGQKPGKVYTHDLSKAAFKAVQEVTKGQREVPEDSIYAQLAPLMMGPMALLVFPTVTPAHLAATLSILAPQAPQFPAPTRRKNPGYYDPQVTSALQKLILLGGRVEDKVFDLEGIRWVGSIEGGLESLRAQLVTMLQGAGLGLTTTLECAGRSLCLTMESRRSALKEENQNDGKGDIGAMVSKGSS